ncbi:hypothetical protein HHL22_10115 [Hymenobacter sp. RP-2-7]|uniref:Uncharacterized protein n=1 Tax=Hymenobacter polaris TaxID=2682546 RepID=A0A7Y0ADY7_9BACT|nr:hypothetical protein [Hymenobacter polaris]NML65559.1 hypothetical protein [Hymenobacter polaris]
MAEEVLAWREYPLPHGKRYYAADLDTEDEVEQLFDYCQILEAIIFDIGWEFLIKRYSLEKLYEINKRSGWHDVYSVDEYKQWLPSHLFSK